MASSCKYTLSDVEFIFPVIDSFTAATFSCWNRFEAVPKRQKYVTGAQLSLQDLTESQTVVFYLNLSGHIKINLTVVLVYPKTKFGHYKDEYFRFSISFIDYRSLFVNRRAHTLGTAVNFN